MARTKVYPLDPESFDVATTGTPETELHALMQAAPFVEPPLSKEQLDPVLDAVVAAMDVLTERERWIVEAHIWDRRSIRTLEKQLSLSKTHVHRIFKGALVKLRDELEANGVGADIVRSIGRVDS